MDRTIVQHLESAAERHPDQLAFRYLVDGEDLTAELSYAELYRRAAGLAGILSQYASPGERVILLFAAGLESLIGLYACFMAGLIAVPTPAPHPGRIRSQSDRLLGVVADCEPALVLTTSELLAMKETFAGLSWTLAAPKWLAVDAIDTLADAAPARACAEDVAILQYTSGSASTPRGVILSHGNIVANQAVIGEIADRTRQTHMMSWLPFYHDMGLCFYFQPVHHGVPCTLMSPARFMQRPLRWLKALSRYRCTATATPNFALDRVSDQIGEGDDERIDLSELRALVVGAEPIRARTLQRFCQATAPMGFRPEFLFPCYGMAESTLICTTGPRGAPTMRRFEPETLAPARTPRLLEGDDEVEEAAILVGNGAAGQEHELIVVTDDGAPTDGNVGEVWLRGPSVGRGYWGRPAETEHAFDATLPDRPDRQYLRTGDLGFWSRGELFICGRSKDLIIVRGRNVYPEDVAQLVREASPEIGEGIAAFEAEDGRRLVILAETRSRRPEEVEAVQRSVRERVASRLEIEVAEFILVAPLSLPRTSSGKIQRDQARRAHRDGALQRIAGRSLEPVHTS